MSKVTSQLQDLLANVIAAIEAQISNQTAAFQTEVANLTEFRKAQFKEENEKLATSLTERSEAANMELRETFNAKLRHEIQGVSDRADILKRDNEGDIDNLTKCVESLIEGINKIVQT